MENTNEKAGSLASLSFEINRLFDQLENHIAPAPASSVPALESGRSNADKLPYRHQSVIRSVFKVSYSPEAEFKTLCQDCLRVVCHPDLDAQMSAHSEMLFCDCGGALCCCNDCLDTASLLIRGGSNVIHELIRVGSIKPISGAFVYSPATGLVVEVSK